MDGEEVLNYPTEFLSSLEIRDCRNAHYNSEVVETNILKKPEPIALYNSRFSRLIVKQLCNFYTELHLLLSCGRGKCIILTDLPLIQSDCSSNFKEFSFL